MLRNEQIKLLFIFLINEINYYKTPKCLTKNHLISYDNIFVAFETLYKMNNHKLGKSGFMVLKLYMSKAYDRVEWTFLEVIMRKLVIVRGKSTLWCCVKFVSYSILVNRQPKGFDLFIWGVHQGDSLSPTFFYCVMKVSLVLSHRRIEMVL